MLVTVTRRAVAADVPAIRELTRAAYAEWVPMIGREPRPMTANYDLAVAKHIIDLFEAHGELLALIEMIALADHLLIENIAVRPDQQGAGLGVGLVSHAENLACTMGYKDVRLYTNLAFATNIEFYAKRGFQEYRRETIGSSTVVVHMMKRVINPK
jgi:N-acetylglutamate synthase-like GNAT family acetyltransferase